MDSPNSELQEDLNENAESINEEESFSSISSCLGEASNSSLSEPSTRVNKAPMSKDEASKPKQPKISSKKQEEREAQLFQSLSEPFAQRAKKVSEGAQNKNSTILFGKFVAESLVELDPISRKHAQFQLNNIIYKAQMGLLEQQQMQQQFPTPNWMPPGIQIGSSVNQSQSWMASPQQYQANSAVQINNADQMGTIMNQSKSWMLSAQQVSSAGQVKNLGMRQDASQDGQDTMEPRKSFTGL